VRRIALAAFAATLTFLALAAPAAAGGCINESRPTDGTSPDVRIAQCQFMSAILRVPVGTTVTWTNADWLPHEVSGIGWGGVQRMLMPGDTFAHDFTEAGIYPYSCPLHPGMSAVVLVGDAAAAEAQPATIATKLDTGPRAPAKPSRDGEWLATALLASILVGVTAFAAGRYLGR
jgi:plastocyanin